MNLKIFRECQFKCCQWSGGQTTEVFISPDSASYKKKDFDCRVSTASVEKGYSHFTNFSGIDRFLILLEGTIDIWHNHGQVIQLHPFEPHLFQGKDITESLGACRDFNVMIKKDMYNFSQYYVIGEYDSKISLTGERVFLFAADGRYSFSDSENHFYILQRGELAVSDELSGYMNIHPENSGHLIVISIRKCSLC